MFDHVKFGVSDYEASKAFFLQALRPLGVTVATEWPPNGVELSQPGGKACARSTARPTMRLS
jgi:hypothetical protein